ncbi:MAG: ATP-binding protein [Lentisphaerae bacterium]|nr:ATP-binding protein [Lentisphaerota bacterium]
MNYMPRNIDSDLTLWAGLPANERHPLLVRGARQVGKSSSVRNMSNLFENFVELNLEQHRDVHVAFEGTLDPVEILRRLSVILGRPITPGNTLLFLDEVQSCPGALEALRYFYEQLPVLHVIAAGSLLEFALEEIPSFGVGRIRSLFMQPLSFGEFMVACGENLLWEEICSASPTRPLLKVFHDKSLELLRQFLLVGGMPKSVATYIRARDMLEVMQIIDDLVISFQADFAKYKRRIPSLLLREVFESVAAQAGGKFVFTKAANTTIYSVKQAVSLLTMAGLVLPVISTAANGVPLGAEANHSKVKMLLLDTGFTQRLLGLDLTAALFSNDFTVINKGAIAEQFVGLELKKASSVYSPENLYYWCREDKKGNAEVDYVVARDGAVIPIEVKSGGRGSMQSMRLMMEMKKIHRGVRTSLENFACYDGIEVWPLYAISNLR